LYGLAAQDGCEGGTEVHHIVARSQGGDDILENGILLCHKHHEQATRHEIQAEAFREILARFYGANSRQTPPGGEANGHLSSDLL
jgi:5-methylcytosine-specific restriction endonuclease McrA